MSQMTKNVTGRIYDLLEQGIDKEKIYDTIENEMKIPRPTIRRIARDLKLNLAKYFHVLNKDSKLGKVVPETDVPRY